MKKPIDLNGIVKGIKSSYGEKYSERDYADFLIRAQNVKAKRDLITLVENLFDLDRSDAKCMVG